MFYYIRNTLNYKKSFINTGHLMNDGHNETGTGERKLIWDEENRLLAVDDNGFVSNVLL